MQQATINARANIQLSPSHFPRLIDVQVKAEQKSIAKAVSLTDAQPPHQNAPTACHKCNLCPAYDRMNEPHSQQAPTSLQSPHRDTPDRVPHRSDLCQLHMNGLGLGPVCRPHSMVQHLIVANIVESVLFCS